MTLIEYITTSEASRRSGYTTTHIAFLLRSGKIKGHKFGHAWMVNRQSFEAYLEQVGREANGRYGPRRYGPRSSFSRNIFLQEDNK